MNTKLGGIYNPQDTLIGIIPLWRKPQVLHGKSGRLLWRFATLRRTGFADEICRNGPSGNSTKRFALIAYF